MNKVGVVSIFDPASFEIIWKDIPNWSNYQASNLGTIRHKRIGRTSKLYPVKTSVGTYLNASGISDDKKLRATGSHIMVCRAFHGLPPSDDHEVNHKDGNKHHNCPSNLEWVLRSENLKHAYAEGLRKENRRVIVTNHSTGKVETYYSMAELARAFNVTASSVWAMITNHSTVKYLGQFTFEFVDGTVSNKRASTRMVYAFDYRTDTLHAFDNLADLELTTGVKRGTAAWHLSRGSKELVKGYAFAYREGIDDFPEYTDEAVMLSLLTKHAGKGQPIEVTDTLTNTTKVYGSIPDFAKDVGIKHPNTVRRALYGKGGKLDNYLIKQCISSLAA